MKIILFSSFFLVVLGFAAQGQDKEVKPAAKGVVYGAALSPEGKAVSTDELADKISDEPYEGKVTGKVAEVCKAMGCWIKLQKSDGTTLMVKSKDHQFFMPQNLVGRTVLIEGTAYVKEVPEEMRKHYAEDAGKTKEEIEKIKGSEKQLQFVAKGVKVLD